MKEKISEILKYYSHYENQVILKQSVLEVDKHRKKKENSFRFLEESSLKDFSKLEACYQEVKCESILEKMKQYYPYIKGQQEKECYQMIKDFVYHEDRKSIQKLEDILKKGTNVAEEKWSQNFKRILSLLEENTIVIATTLLKEENRNKIKMIPLFLFHCEKGLDKMIPNSVTLNFEAAVHMMATIYDRDVLEITIEYEEKLNEFSKIIVSYIDGGSVDHVLENVISEFIKKFDLTTYSDRLKQLLEKKICIATEDFFGQAIQSTKQDLLALDTVLKYRRYIPSALKKYLFGSKEQKEIDNKQYQKGYKGSYPSKFGVNRLQYKIVNAMKDNELIALQGPPGTGKTSLIKEMIANYIVERAEFLCEHFDEEWEKVKVERSNNVYYSFRKFHENQELIKSVVVSSKNKEAISNIGDEINHEIGYLEEIATAYQITTDSKLKKAAMFQGLICAKLGNNTNKQDFEDFLYQIFIPYLENAKEDTEVKQKFVDQKNKLEKILEECLKLEYLCGKVTESTTELQQQLEKFIQAEKEICDTLTRCQQEEKIRKEQLVCQQDRLKELIKRVEQKNEEIISRNKTIEMLQEQMTLFYKTPLQRLIQRVISKEARAIYKYKTLENLKKESQKEQLNISDLEKEKTRILDEKVQAEEVFQEIQNVYEKKKKQLEKIKESYDMVKRQKQEKQKIIHINQTYQIEFCQIKEMSDLLHCQIIRNKKEELFLLALQLNQAYMIKNKTYILHNLRLFLKDGKFCSPFYDSSDLYAEQKENAIKTLWNTLFLCFPVVTTTLDSFHKRNFALIENLIDLLIVDEAGQILPHNLITPLYRSKKALIVGDIYQIPPIYTSVVMEKDTYEKKIGELFEKFKIEENSVQRLENLHSDLIQKGEFVTLQEHYRCEENIIDFSNTQIYGKKLTCCVKDDKVKPFSDNLVAFDIRGKKDKNSHSNLAEAKACIRIIQQLLKSKEVSGIQMKEIAIITPFKKQVKVIKQLLEEHGLEEVEVGTTHTFQGKQKEYILFNTVLDDLVSENSNKEKFLHKRLLKFIAATPNLLNVAVTRAKKQFILVGNFECYEQDTNYLNQLFYKIKNDGKVYSLYIDHEKPYPSEIVTLLLGDSVVLKKDRIGDYISTQVPLKLLDGPRQHYHFLLQMLEMSQKSVYISAPWVTKNVVDDDFMNLIQNKRKQQVKVKITYGYSKIKKKAEQIEEIAKREKRNIDSEKEYLEVLKQLNNCLKEDLVYHPPIHSKILLVDEQYLWIGSHNWLSNAGKSRMETSEISNLTTDKEQIEYIKEKYF